MVAVLICAGLRRKELLWLTRDDVNLRSGATGLLRIQTKSIHGESRRPKTTVQRAIPISRILRRHTVSIANAVGSSRASQWGCLDYRRAFGSQLAQKRVSLYKIATLMGNSPEIRRRHYAALVPEATGGEVEFPTRSIVMPYEHTG